jgi:hypothetical protein
MGSVLRCRVAVPTGTELTSRQKSALICKLLNDGYYLTVPQVMRLTGLKRVAAYELLCELAEICEATSVSPNDPELPLSLLDAYRPDDAHSGNGAPAHIWYKTTTGRPPRCPHSIIQHYTERFATA